MKFSTGFMDVGIKIRKDLKAYELRLKRATKIAARETAEGLKTELRSQVFTAGLGLKVANAWRSAAYPKDKDSLNAVASVWSKAPHIIDAYNRGVPIRAKRRKFLAIPTQVCPKIGRDGKAIKPSNFPEERYGELRFVWSKNRRTAFFVADNQRASYSKKTKEFRGFKKASDKAKASGKGLTTVIMFILVPATHPRKRLDVEGAAAKWAAQFGRALDRGMASL